MHTDRRRFRSESLMRSSLCTHSCRIRLRTSRIRSWAEIIGTLGRLRRTGGDVCGGPNMSDSSSPARPALPGFVGRVIICCFASRPSEMGTSEVCESTKNKNTARDHCMFVTQFTLFHDVPRLFELFTFDALLLQRCAH
uniref:(northern house mosquito) hypothetical protein n=1 Tax=Culex pipiens TaxID=7175 RepID=A0A8D8E124_CULPI